jgi:hypothetical protein
MLAVVCPVDQAYVAAPEAVSTVLAPAQTAAGGVMEITGTGLTVTVVLLEAEHPEEVPVTEYVVVVEGETVMLAVVWPVDHAYVPAPEAVNTVPEPEQIDKEGETVTTGTGFTVTVVLFPPVQPDVVPETEYVVVEEGETEMLAVVWPLDQR